VHLLVNKKTLINRGILPSLPATSSCNFTFFNISPILRRSLSDTFYASSFWTKTVWYTLYVYVYKIQCMYVYVYQRDNFFIGVLRIRASVLLGHAARSLRNRFPTFRDNIFSLISKCFSKGRDSITH
jgi:hypothetical protein